MKLWKVNWANLIENGLMTFDKIANELIKLKMGYWRYKNLQFITKMRVKELYFFNKNIRQVLKSWLYNFLKPS